MHEVFGALGMSGPAASEDWVPVALGQSVPAGTAAPALVASTEVALWRGASGAVHAWRDRCPHRGMRLSFGFVRGDDLTCLYHGWRYGADGGARYIPAHPELEPPKSICAEVYPCVESGGLVWMRLGAANGPGQPPKVGPEAIPVRSLTIDAGADLVCGRLAAGQFPAAPPLRPAAVAPNLFTLSPSTADAEWGPLIAAVQPASDMRTNLHLLVVAPGIEDRAALMVRISRSAERFRRECEARPPNAPREQDGHT